MFALIGGLTACDSDPIVNHLTDGQTPPPPIQVDIEDVFERYAQLPERVLFQKSIRFHGIVKGARSYDETIFDSGKLIQLNVKEGQIVEKDQLIATLYSPDLAEKLTQAQAKLNQAESQLSLDKEDFQRAKHLFEKSLIAKQELEKAQRNFNYALQAKDEAQAGVSVAENVFADTSIVAKEPGVISQLYKREGDFINRGEAIFRIESIDKQRATFAIPEHIAVKVVIGSLHEITIPATNHIVTGTVVEKSLPTENGIRLHKVTIEFSSEANSLMGLRAEFNFQHQNIEAFAVDYRAVRYDGNNTPFIIIAENDAAKNKTAEQDLTPKRITILDLSSSNAVLSGDIDPDSPIIIGNDVSIPVDFSQL